VAKLTKTSIGKLLMDGAGANARIHWDDALGGFGLRIYPSGAASYVVDYRLRGSRLKRRIVLGSVSELSLDQARERARRARQAARDGVDLDRQGREEVKQREAELKRKAGRITVRKAIASYLDAFETTPLKRSGLKPACASVRQASVWLKRLVAMYGEMALEDLTREHIQALLESAPQASRRNIYGALRQFLAWTRRQGLIETAPLDGIEPPARPTSRDRTPSPREVAAILAAADRALAEGRWRQVQRDAIWLLALSAQRRAEVASMAWEDLDLEAAEWRQPGTKNKTRTTHVVSLGACALDILKRAHTAAGRPQSGLVLRGVRFGGRIDANLGDLHQVLRLETGIAFRLHDFRRAAVSAMAERGVDFAVADSLLNHAASQSRGGMLGVYQRAELKGAKRRAMEIWETAVTENTSATNVIPLRMPATG
jgi:integrase